MNPGLLLRLLIGSLILTVLVRPVRSQQTPSASPTPSAQTSEQRALRDKRLAERRADTAKRAAERQARAAKLSAERQATAAKRAADRQARAAKLSAERQATAAKRAAERQAAAAGRAAENEKRRALNDGTFRFVSSRMNADFARVVKGAPYSAVAITEHVQKFVDGNQIVRRNEALYYRDSEGRTRVEQKLSTIGKWSASGDAPRIIMIGDPVSGEYYSLDPRTRTAVKNIGLGKRLEELRLKQEQKLEGPKPPARTPASPAGAQVSSDGRRRTESLGSQRIEGVEAVGKRTTTTIPAGEIGNTLPIEITDESWFSEGLQTVVMTKHHDPRSGDTIYRLTNISRREPDRSLFQVPADYRIVDTSRPKTAPPKPKIDKERRSKSEVVIE